MTSIGHAHGKLILLGEHAVVHGVPAIAAGIERGAVARARPSSQTSLEIAGNRCGEDGSELGRALAALLRALGVGPHEIEIEVDLPLGCGLGASAAMAVAIARAVLGTEASDARVLEAAAAWETVFHGNPSGIDAAAATLGGCILFSRADGMESLPLGSDLQLAVALAGPPAKTRDMVEAVARLFARRPETVQRSFNGIHSLVRNARHCLEAGDVWGLGKLMDLNQMLLSGLFVSTESIEQACRTAREAGALGAKLTGAGGGGSVVALVEADAAPVLTAWRALGLTCFATTIRRTSPEAAPSGGRP
jgi:mevalonate kinase